MKINFNIDLDDNNYGRININTTSIDKLNNILKVFKKTIGELPYNQNNKYEFPLLPSAKLDNYGLFTTIKVGPVIFPDGETGYFHTPVSSWRHKTNWDHAKEYCESIGFFLPTKEELDLLIKYKHLIDFTDISTIERAFKDIENEWCWSSSEFDSNYIYIQRPLDGYTNHSIKSSKYWAIPFRKIDYE